MFEKEAEEWVKTKGTDAMTCLKENIGWDDVCEQAFKDGAEFGYNKANEWHYVKDGDLPKKDCEVITLHENGNKNIIKWKNGNWTNAIVIPVIAWKEIVLPELKESK